MLKPRLLLSMLVLLAIFVATPAVAQTTLTFEEFLGFDSQPLSTFYQGVTFIGSSTGSEWVSRDATTNLYNVSSWNCLAEVANANPLFLNPQTGELEFGDFWICDRVSATTALDSTGDDGIIEFDKKDATFVEIRYSSFSELTLLAFDASEDFIASATGPPNLRFTNENESGPGTIRVEAPMGVLIGSVVISDMGNFWTIDNLTTDASVSVNLPPLCTGSTTAEGVGVDGTATDDNGIASVVLAPGALNLDLTVGAFEPGQTSVTFFVGPDIAGSDADGSVLVTDTEGLTCSLPVNFISVAAGPAEEKVVCAGEGIVLQVSNPVSNPGGVVTCVGSEVVQDPQVLPAGLEPTRGDDQFPCRTFNITSPIAGTTVMVLDKQGDFLPNLRIVFSFFDGSQFTSPVDVTESVVQINPTRARGRGGWSEVQVSCALLAEICNGIDDDLDGLIDENLPVGNPTVDEDMDGFPLCPAVGELGDCSDTNPNINPDMIEICDNGIDDNCNGDVDLDDINCDPLVVVLTSFTATPEKDGVLLEWETSLEIDTAGFRILRARSGGEPVEIHAGLIPAEGDPFSTTSYSFFDSDWQQPGEVSYYLEDIDLGGEVTRHQPMELRLKRRAGVKR